MHQAVLWNMDTLQTETTPEEHQYLITDIRFRPNSSQLATASFDKSVRLWDASNVIIFIFSTGTSDLFIFLPFSCLRTPRCSCKALATVAFFNKSNVKQIHTK